MSISSAGSISSEAGFFTPREPVVRANVSELSPSKVKEAGSPETRPTEKTSRPENRPEPPALEKAQLEELVAIANKRLKSTNAVISFDVDKDTKMVVTTLLDSRTNEVIRQIPSEAVLEIARSIDKFASVLIQEKA